jgi:hypothetical protein
VSTANCTQHQQVLRREVQDVIEEMLPAGEPDLAQLDGVSRLQVVARLEGRFDVYLPADLVSEAFTLEDLTWFTARLISHTKERSP